jgi:hypothetical protein
MCCWRLYSEQAVYIFHMQEAKRTLLETTLHQLQQTLHAGAHWQTVHARELCLQQRAENDSHSMRSSRIPSQPRTVLLVSAPFFHIAYVGPGPFPHPQGRLVGVSLMQRCMTPPIFAAGWGTYWRHYSYPLTPKSISVAG